MFHFEKAPVGARRNDAADRTGAIGTRGSEGAFLMGIDEYKRSMEKLGAELLN